MGETTTTSSASSAAAWQAAGQIGSAAIGAAAQSNLNKKTRKWNEEQYAKQRADSLADWERVNIYNSPASQMQRFREAGLNPNLIYGQSNTADAVRSSETPSWNPRAPDFNINPGETIQTYFNVKMQEAQLRNLETVNTVQQQEALLKGAQTQSTLASIPNLQASTDRTKWETAQSQSLAPYVLEASKANLQKLSAETNQLIDNNERQAALTAQSLQQGIENILLIRLNRAKGEAEITQLKQALENLKTDNDIKKENLKLLQRGQNPNDPTWMRQLGIFLEKYLPSQKPTDGPGMKNFKWKF